MNADKLFKPFLRLLNLLLLFSVAVIVIAQEPVDDQESSDGDSSWGGTVVTIRCSGNYSTPCAGTKSGNQYCTSCNSMKCTSSSDPQLYCATAVVGSTGHFHCFAGYKKTGGGNCYN